LSEFKHIQDKVNPGTWLNPGASGCKTKDAASQSAEATFSFGAPQV